MAKPKKSSNKPNVTKISASNDKDERTLAEETMDEQEMVAEDELTETTETTEEEDEVVEGETETEEDTDDAGDETADEDDSEDEDSDEDDLDDEDDDEEEDDDDDESEEVAKTTTKTCACGKANCNCAEAAKVDENLPHRGFFKALFAKKRTENESILTIFSQRRIYGALLGEVIGTAVLTMIVLTLGLYQPLYMFIVILAVTLGVYKLSGANLYPVNTFGMMVSRRISVIRGVLYLLAQVIGAWVGYLLISALVKFAAQGGEVAELPGMAPIAMGDTLYPATVLLEFVGSVVVGLSFARAQDYKDKPLAFAAIVAGGVMIATVVVYLVSYSYFGLQENFMLNPAIALMYQILPTSADGLGELLGAAGSALLCYALLPMLGGALGFLISDVAKICNEE